MCIDNLYNIYIIYTSRMYVFYTETRPVLSGPSVVLPCNLTSPGSFPILYGCLPCHFATEPACHRRAQKTACPLLPSKKNRQGYPTVKLHRLEDRERETVSLWSGDCVADVLKQLKIKMTYCFCLLARDFSFTATFILFCLTSL